MVVAFTGYRPEKMPFSEDCKNRQYLEFRRTLSSLIDCLIKQGFTYFISGVARGFDTWVAEEVIGRRETNSNIYLECAVPFPGQADLWEEEDQRRRYKILVSADKAVVVSERYRRGCFFARNRYMIDKADLVVCAFNGQSGGTADTVKYALKHDKVVIQIDPANNIISLINQGDSNIYF